MKQFPEKEKKTICGTREIYSKTFKQGILYVDEQGIWNNNIHLANQIRGIS